MPVRPLLRHPRQRLERRRRHRGFIRPRRRPVRLPLVHCHQRTGRRVRRHRTADRPGGQRTGQCLRALLLWEHQRNRHPGQ
jgi:hypothetical protein